LYENCSSRERWKREANGETNRSGLENDDNELEKINPKNRDSENDEPKKRDLSTARQADWSAGSLSSFAKMPVSLGDGSELNLASVQGDKDYLVIAISQKDCLFCKDMMKAFDTDFGKKNVAESKTCGFVHINADSGLSDVKQTGLAFEGYLADSDLFDELKSKAFKSAASGFSTIIIDKKGDVFKSNPVDYGPQNILSACVL